MDFISDDLYGNNPELEFKKREYVYLSSIASLEFELERLKNTFSGLPLERYLRCFWKICDIG